MAPEPPAVVVSSLRAVTFRLTSTPTQQLPQQIPHITGLLQSCKPLLSLAQSFTGRETSETGVLVHKFKTRVSSLLQDRTVEGRWTAVVLIKSAVELGGWEVLQKCGPWVRGLLLVLSKPDPPTTKKLCIITLTRIFLLTRDYPSLVREFTTPSLPPFITACLKNVGSKPGALNSAQASSQRALTQAILESFGQLVPHHPATFRTFQAQIQQLVAHVLSASTTSAVSEETCQAAQRLLVQLHYCAPKNTSSEEWDVSCQKAVACVHNTADNVFRSVIEEWRSVSGHTSRANPLRATDDEPYVPEPDFFGLLPWSSIANGGARMITHLGILEQHVNAVTPLPVALRLGSLLDLLERLMTLAVPNATDSVRVNNQISKKEREELWAVLPSIHIAAMEVVMALVRRLGLASIPLTEELLRTLCWVFEAERQIMFVRKTVYSAVDQLINIVGTSISQESITALNSIVRSCCNDLLPPVTNSITTPEALTNGKPSKASAVNADALLGPAASSQTPPADFGDLRAAADSLLAACLAHLPAKQIPAPMRTLMDRTAILTRNKDAMVASVVNSAPRKASILPILARMFPGAPEVELLLRPRMPAIKLDNEDVDADEEVDDEVANGNGALYEGLSEPTAPMDLAGSEEIPDIGTRSAEWSHLDALPGAEPAPTPIDPVAGALGAPSGGSDSAKRTLSVPSQDAPSPKRICMDQEASMPHAETTILALSPLGNAIVVDPVIPVTVAAKLPTQQEGLETVVTLSQAQMKPIASRNETDDGEDNDDDFEVPKLTMDVDTEDEDE